MDNQKSGYIKHQEEQELQSAQRSACIDEVVKTCLGLGGLNLPSERMMNIIGSHSEGHFKLSMVGLFQELVKRGRLDSDSTLLDIGSGCGRLAIPFSYFIHEGMYYGTDVWQEGIRWCQDNISTRNPNFLFIQQLAANDYYHGQVTDKRNRFGLHDIESGSVDFVFAISTFTHLLEEDCQQYFYEMQRVMHSESVAYITAFIIDEWFFDFVAKTGLHQEVHKTQDGCYHAYGGQDFFAGFTLEKWINMLSKANLKFVSHELGAWAEKPGSSMYQDTFIVTPSSSLAKSSVCI
jgi:ubiquinone/menaquinone biosynthesis C-methylase UbiE